MFLFVCMRSWCARPWGRSSGEVMQEQRGQWWAPTQAYGHHLPAA